MNVHPSKKSKLIIVTNKNEKEIKEAEVERSTKMLSTPGFISKAPEAKVQEEKDKLAKYQEMLKATKERLESL